MISTIKMHTDKPQMFALKNQKALLIAMMNRAF